MNTYALVGTQRSADGYIFCTLQATRDYVLFVKRRLEANPQMTVAQMNWAHHQTASLWTEDVNDSRGRLTMTQAIYDTFPARAIEYWNSSVYVVAAPNSNQNRNGPAPSKKQKTSDRGQQISDTYQALPDLAAKANWEAKRNGKDLCRNYQIGLCRFKPCRNLHECALPSCAGLNHPAKDCPKRE